MTPSQPLPRSSPAPALAGAAFRGSIWLFLSTGFTRAASLLATIVLGRLLNDHQWGIYAIAMSAAMVAGALRDGGVRQILLQRQREYDTLLGPVFWLAFAMSLLAGALLALWAPLIARLTNEPQTRDLMLVIAASLPLSTPGAFYQTRLSIDMRFRDVGRIQSVSGVLRFGGAIVLALLGFGPLSFVLPMLACALNEWIMGWSLTKERLWSRRRQPALWPPLLDASVWVMLGTLAIALLNWGGNLAIKGFLDTAVVGAYFFAFQIVVQVAILLSSNINSVLFPTFAKIIHQRDRLAAAAIRSLRQVMLLAAPLSVGLAVTFPSLESLFWKGHRANSITPVLIQGSTYALCVLQAVPLSLQQARGHFKSWALGLILTAAATLSAAMLGASIHQSAAGVALWAGLSSAFGGLSYTLFVFRRIGVPLSTTLSASLPAWTIALLCGLAAWRLDALLALSDLGATSLGLDPSWHQSFTAIIRFLLVGSAFSLAFALFIRALIPSHVHEALAILPTRLRDPAQRLLRIRGSPR